MSVDIQTEGGFHGTKRQGMIYYRLFTLLSGYDGHYKSTRGWEEFNKEDDMIFSWLMRVKGWSVVSLSEGWFFASLARAIPDADFWYNMCMTEEIGAGDQSLGEISYGNGKLNFYSAIRIVSGGYNTFIGECPNCGASLTLNEDEASEDTYECPNCGETIDLDEINLDDEWNDDDEDYEEQGDGFNCHVDKEGNIEGDSAVAQQCLSAEKQALSDLLALMEMGTEDPQQVMDLGMICETGIAGIQKDLTRAWDYYMKAANAGDAKALRFVSEIFADENRTLLRELLQNRNFSSEAYPVLFDLGQAKNNPELTAELLAYKQSPEVQNGIAEYSDLSGEDEDDEEDRDEDEDWDEDDKRSDEDDETAGFEELTIPDGVTDIDERKYRNNRSLKSVIIPGSVKSIGHMAFENCTKLQRAAFSEGLERIGIQAFSGCTSLTHVTLPESLRTLGLGAFYECERLSEINIPAGVTEIKRACFTRTALYNDKHNRDNGALYIDGCLIVLDDAYSGSFTVKEGTRLIAASAFWACSRLTEIIIPESVEYIDDYAFGQCGNLAKVTLPGHLKRIGTAAFWKCRSLADERGMTIIRGTLYDYSGDEKLVTVPGDIVCIEASSFDSNGVIESVTIENGVTAIKGAELDTGAFYNCGKLRDVFIPESVQCIEEYAFAGSPKVVIHAPAGSCAEIFAKKKGIRFSAE